ncbi:MAG TPA: TolC family protein [Sunxiuqinia sp.]|nr:TolC family protein [Sunxiuqinia sp.]
MKIRKRLLFILLLPAQLVLAQEPVHLSDCQQWAREQHPLLKQKELYRKMSELKLENNKTNYLPNLNLNARATYQSAVTSVDVPIPNVNIPSVSKDQYKMYVDVKQNIWDGGLTKANEILEKAQDAANEQGVEVELYKVREQVNSLFFTSFFIQQNLDILGKKQETLEARKKQMQSGVDHGVILQSDLDQILAELVKVDQQKIELQSNRETVLSALAIFTGKQPGDLQNLVIDNQDQLLDNQLNRPELGLFQKQADALMASSNLIQKKRNPKLFGFGQAGYGRPALNMLNDNFDTYYLVGVGFKWNIFDWKNTKRDQEIIQMKQQMINTQQQQFERSINIALDRQKHKIGELENILKSDQNLIELQLRIARSAESKLDNGTITTSDYIKDVNAEAAARIILQTHKIRLEQAKIDYQNIQGK